MDLGTLTLLANIVLGYVGQWFKAHKAVSTSATQTAMFLIGAGIHAAWAHTGPTWAAEAIVWGASINGFASSSAGLGLAPKTDSIITGGSR